MTCMENMSKVGAQENINVLYHHFCFFTSTYEILLFQPELRELIYVKGYIIKIT